MMRRRIFLWMGPSVLFLSLIFCGYALAGKTYTVQPGDTVYGIATKTGVTPKALKAANQIKDNRLQIKQVLTIPGPKGKDASRAKVSSASKNDFYTVKKKDTLSGIARKTGVSVAQLQELNDLEGKRLKTGQKLSLKKSPEKEPDPSLMLPSEQPNLAYALDMDEDEEEEVDLLTPEEMLAAIEKRKKESAGLLGKWNNPDEPKLLVRVAMGFLGAPYRLGGSTVTGIDCSGFVKNIYKFFNIELPRTAFEQSHVGMRVSRSDLSEGDLIFFRTRKQVGHVGIYIGNNQFVHAASRKRGVRVDNLDQPYFDRRFIRAVRLKGNDDG
jgi:LysM repeat protein